MDIPRLKGVDYLEPGTRIYPEDLDAWAQKAHLKIEPGDAVLIRTGRWALRDSKGPYNTAQLAGLYITCAKWLHQHDAAILGRAGGHPRRHGFAVESDRDFLNISPFTTEGPEKRRRNANHEGPKDCTGQGTKDFFASFFLFDCGRLETQAGRVGDVRQKHMNA